MPVAGNLTAECVAAPIPEGTPPVHLVLACFRSGKGVCHVQGWSPSCDDFVREVTGVPGLLHLTRPPLSREGKHPKCVAVGATSVCRVSRPTGRPRLSGPAWSLFIRWRHIGCCIWYTEGVLFNTRCAFQVN